MTLAAAGDLTLNDFGLRFSQIMWKGCGKGVPKNGRAARRPFSAIAKKKTEDGIQTPTLWGRGEEVKRLLLKMLGIVFRDVLSRSQSFSKYILLLW